MEILFLGKEFFSVEQVKSSVESYQNKTYAQFYIRDSRTIASTLKRKRIPSRKINEALKYCYLTYACIAGGKKFQSKSTGSRPNQRTFQNDCPAEIKFVVGKDGSSLKVVSLKENHNHACNKVAFSHLPQQRRILPSETQEAVKLLEMQYNRKFVQKHLQKITNKVITARDVFNIKKKYLPSGKKKNNVQSIVEKLHQNEGVNFVQFSSTTELMTEPSHTDPSNWGYHGKQGTTRTKNASATGSSLDSLSQPNAAKFQKKTGRQLENRFFENRDQNAMSHSVLPSLPVVTRMQVQQHLQVAAPPLAPAPAQLTPRQVQVLAPTLQVTGSNPKPQILVVADHQRCVESNLVSLLRSEELCNEVIGNGSSTIKTEPSHTGSSNRGYHGKQGTTRTKNASATGSSLDSLSQPTAAKFQKKTGRQLENRFFENRDQKAMSHSVQPSLPVVTQMQVRQHLQVAAPPPVPAPAPAQLTPKPGEKPQILVVANQASLLKSEELCDAGIDNGSSTVKASPVDPKPVEKPQPQKKQIFVVADHQRCVMSNMATLWKSGKLCDAGISNGSSTVMVHKLVLGAVCPKLLSVSNLDMMSHKFLRVNFPETVSNEALNAFAEYMYNGILDLDWDILEQLKIIARRLDMKEFEQLCDSHLPNHMHQPASAAASFTNNPSIQTTKPIAAPLSPTVPISMQSVPSNTVQRIVGAELSQVTREVAAVFNRESEVALLAPNTPGNAAGLVFNPSSIKKEPLGPDDKYGHWSGSASNQTFTSSSNTATATESISIASVPVSPTEFAIPFSEATDVKSTRLKAPHSYEAPLVSDLSPAIVETASSQSSSISEDSSKPLNQPLDSLPSVNLSNSNDEVYPVRLFSARGDNLPLLTTHTSDEMTLNSFIKNEKT